MKTNPSDGIDPTPLQTHPLVPGAPAAAGEQSTSRLGDCLLLEQRDGWPRGQRVLVESYLRRYPELLSDEQTLIDLIYNEYLLRQEIGDHPRAEEYFERFPLQRESLRRQFTLDQELIGSDSEVCGLETGSPGEERTTVAPTVDAAPPSPTLGRIGKYPLVALLDEGGQAQVYRAVNPELGRDVVIKVGRLNRPGASADHERLKQEGRILAELEHPNLARVYDLDLDQGRIFLVMEYVRGQNLEQFARAAKPSPVRAATLIAQVARALAVVHQRGVVHLDIKPKNILIDESGRPRLIDFGLARWRQCWSDAPGVPEGVSGTVAYMPPEQARGDGERVGAASDLFALGGVLYFLLTGRPVFEGENFGEVFERARSCSFDRSALNRPGIPPRLAAVCLRALSADPLARHPRAEELAADLEAFVRAPKRRAWTIAVAVVFVAALAVGSVWAFTRRTGPAPRAVIPMREIADGASLPLRVRVWAGDRYVGLTKAAPLRTGDQFQVLVEAPPESHVSLFLFTSDGRLRLLAEREPESVAGVLRFPRDEDQAVPLTGAAGTECLLVCGRRAGPIRLEDVQQCWGEAGPWPALPGASVLRLSPRAVESEGGRGRDVGTPVARVDPEAEVRRRLEALRLRLRERFDYFEGLAFAHEE